MLYALSKMRNQLNISFPIVVPSQFVIFFFLIDKHIFDEGIEQGGIHYVCRGIQEAISCPVWNVLSFTSFYEKYTFSLAWWFCWEGLLWYIWTEQNHRNSLWFRVFHIQVERCSSQISVCLVKRAVGVENFYFRSQGQELRPVVITFLYFLSVVLALVLDPFFARSFLSLINK